MSGPRGIALLLPLVFLLRGRLGSGCAGFGGIPLLGGDRVSRGNGRRADWIVGRRTLRGLFGRRGGFGWRDGSVRRQPRWHTGSRISRQILERRLDRILV